MQALVIAEWDDDNQVRVYTCDDFEFTDDCIPRLGKFQVRDVRAAAFKAAAPPNDTYDVNKRNCNHWTERCMRFLNADITVHWNCSCGLQSFAY